MSQKQRDQARERKRRQRDRERDKSVTDVTVERDRTPEMSRPDVTPSRCMDCGVEVPFGDNTCVPCYRDPQPAPKGGYYIPHCMEPKRRPASYTGAGPTANYKPPLVDWKGMGYCRDCNTKVPPKDNTCRECFFGS